MNEVGKGLVASLSIHNSPTSSIVSIIQWQAYSSGGREREIERESKGLDRHIVMFIYIFTVCMYCSETLLCQYAVNVKIIIKEKQERE